MAGAGVGKGAKLHLLWEEIKNGRIKIIQMLIRDMEAHSEIIT